jgi:hypothetical protein
MTRPSLLEIWTLSRWSFDPFRLDPPGRSRDTAMVAVFRLAPSHPDRRRYLRCQTR